MDGNVLTISLASWMELPALDLKTWQSRTQKAHGHAHAHGDEHEGQEQGLLHEGRASVAAVAQYYSDYVQLQGLSKYFRSGVSVTSISPVPASKLRHWWRTKRCCRERDMKPLWRVDGVDLATGARLHYVTPHVVLATGGTDQRNRLGVPGELTLPDEPSPFGDNRIVHDLRSLEEAVANLAQEADDVTNLDPVLIVGAGLSAADAVIAARFHSLPVLHVFRNRSVPADRQLPENMYPEYHKVHQMMGDGGASYPLYRSLAEHHVVDLTGMHSDGKVVIEGADGSRTAHRVSLVAILIGSRPDLSPIRPACSGADGLGLGVNPHAPVDCRSNPIDVDPWSYEVTRAPQRGLFSLGPISGDTFVRFVQGGSLGIAASISASAKTNS